MSYDATFKLFEHNTYFHIIKVASNVSDGDNFVLFSQIYELELILLKLNVLKAIILAVFI